MSIENTEKSIILKHILYHPLHLFTLFSYNHHIFHLLQLFPSPSNNEKNAAHPILQTFPHFLIKFCFFSSSFQNYSHILKRSIPNSCDQLLDKLLLRLFSVLFEYVCYLFICYVKKIVF